MINNIDKFLHIDKDIETGTYYYNEDYSQMRDLKSIILNNFHSIIHKLPHTSASLDKFHYGMEKLRTIINSTLDNIHGIVNNKNRRQGINTDTAFVYRNHPKPTDPMGNASWTFYQGDI